ncbi:hypothetical protein M409DRAFT_19280 [Zasmidium cellare ATCC 36951]|uniref:MFS maltose permease n=1 Tax=Zasmidium cellare ATCC 36951 TaxID=1080233 RepID=A0A6A6CXD4_ZASCE|nr:uncharacterized protein M409DRAFT_19280 [Zasmidium cellare ATCC 36951]KAF2170459.1 hypothetical protein M409DRAFT_19280 [Zasmidium cellare ATCC 36951]
MLSQRATTPRILSIRPLRPPSSLQNASKPRLFTQNSPLLLIAQRSNALRPQLPYLTQPAFQRANGPSQQLARLLSTETRTYVKEQTWLAVKWTVIPCTILALATIVYFGISIELEEHENPTPDEWTLLTRHGVRGARHFAQPRLLETAGFIDWAKVGSRLRAALSRLEDPAIDGKGLTEPAGEGEEIVIEGVGRAGFDISAKSWAWRAGYYEVVMGCAAAAEHLDSMVRDKISGGVFQKEFVVGPSNPDPRPIPAYFNVTPLEENVAPASPPPETFYMRILTGKGFTTKQKMEAARAYANWLDFKNLPESAEEMYRWSLDIAKSALPLGVDPDELIDSNTAVLKRSQASSQITPNLLRASTDLATHYATNGNVTAALPILLSVLRARRSTSVSPFPPPPSSQPQESTGGALDIIYSLFSKPKFPSPPPSGDNPLIRISDKPTCEESALMLYIGEILFASTPSKESLGWTKQAVTIAGANLSHPTPTADVDEGEEKRKCMECLATGVRNWEVMLNRLTSTGEIDAGKSGWFSWGGGPRIDSRIEVEEEKTQIEALKDKVARERIHHQAKTPIGALAPNAGWSR